ncbi:MAG: ABC transporter permease [Sulfolobales archaeon]|nr:ABC transporter permease [Sulfolobales archaeon]MCX8199519.1 ABC transporter permease [Sulfolobales archaeon]MDW8170472.1 ABC transporter permease [Desulfurococcaceae archaeon]
MEKNVIYILFLRIIQSFLTLFGLIVIIFILSRILPGNPAIAILGPKATPENIQKVISEWGLDKSYLEQFMIYISMLLRGNLGEAYVMGYSVNKLISERITASFELVIAAFILSSIIGLPLGIYSAKNADSKKDVLISSFAVLGLSFPTILTGIILMVFFGLHLGFPVGGRINPIYSIKAYTGFMLIDTLLNGNFSAFIDATLRIIPPALALAIPLSGLLMRLTRNSMLEVMSQDFIRTARMKRLPEKIILYKHVLRNALIPITTVMGLYFAVIVTGDIIVETIFGWPGIGRLVYEAVMLRDYMVIQGTVLVISVIYILVNLAVDILYIYLDPRIRR